MGKKMFLEQMLQKFDGTPEWVREVVYSYDFEEEILLIEDGAFDTVLKKGGLVTLYCDEHHSTLRHDCLSPEILAAAIRRELAK